MRLTRTTADRIATGRKTQHRVPRRPVKTPDTGSMVTVRSLTTGEEIARRPASSFAKRHLEAPYIPGDSIPITVMKPNRDIGYQRKNPETPRQEGVQVCRVRVTAIYPSHLHELTQTDAIAEGFKTTDDFLADWWQRYREGPGKRDNPEYPVHIPVWVLVFELDTEQRPRLLARASDVNRGYTESPVAAVQEDQVEAVEDDYLNRFARESVEDMNARLLRQEQRIKERGLEDRLAAVKAAARRESIDISSPLRVIERQLEKAESRIHGKRAA